MWVGILQSFENLNRIQRKREGKYLALSSWAGTFISLAFRLQSSWFLGLGNPGLTSPIQPQFPSRLFSKWTWDLTGNSLSLKAAPEGKGMSWCCASSQRNLHTGACMITTVGQPMSWTVKAQRGESKIPGEWEKVAQPSTCPPRFPFLGHHPLVIPMCLICCFLVSEEMMRVFLLLGYESVLYTVMHRIATFWSRIGHIYDGGPIRL